MSYVRDSVEPLSFDLFSTTGADLTGRTIEAAIVPRGKEPTSWLACTHVSGSVWNTSADITWSAANYPLDSYLAYARKDGAARVLLGSFYIH